MTRKTACLLLGWLLILWGLTACEGTGWQHSDTRRSGEGPAAAYGLRFLVDGEVYAELAQVADLSALPLPAEPTKAGYLFEGWYLDPLGTHAMPAGRLTADTALYAVWTPTDGTAPVELRGDAALKKARERLSESYLPESFTYVSESRYGQAAAEIYTGAFLQSGASFDYQEQYTNSPDVHLYGVYRAGGQAYRYEVQLSGQINEYSDYRLLDAFDAVAAVADSHFAHALQRQIGALSSEQVRAERQAWTEARYGPGVYDWTVSYRKSGAEEVFIYTQKSCERVSECYELLVEEGTLTLRDGKVTGGERAVSVDARSLGDTTRYYRDSLRLNERAATPFDRMDLSGKPLTATVTAFGDDARADCFPQALQLQVGVPYTLHEGYLADSAGARVEIAYGSGVVHTGYRLEDTTYRFGDTVTFWRTTPLRLLFQPAKSAHRVKLVVNGGSFEIPDYYYTGSAGWRELQHHVYGWLEAGGVPHLWGDIRISTDAAHTKPVPELVGNHTVYVDVRTEAGGVYGSFGTGRKITPVLDAKGRLVPCLYSGDRLDLGFYPVQVWVDGRRLVGFYYDPAYTRPVAHMAELMSITDDLTLYGKLE
ncbi:MAG: InlB B-repeat-containing protein [Eubacteriales bacterium]